MKKYLYIWALPLTLVACSEKNTTADNHTTTIADFSEKIAIVKPQPETTACEISFTGKVECNPEKTTTYVPLSNGVIERCYFSLGDKIVKGQTMLEIRSSELSALQSELIVYESELALAEREYKTAKELYTDKLLSETEYLQRRSQLVQAQTAYDKAKSDMAIFGTSRGDGVFIIKAPISGYVISKGGTAPGSIFTEGDPLFAIADLSDVWVITNVYAGNLQFVKEGMEANTTSISYPNEIFKGKINAISQVFDPEDRTLKARIVLPNPDMKLKPEMPVMVSLHKDKDDMTLSLPSNAIIFDNNAYYVVTKAEDTFERKEVVTAGHHNGKTYITSGVNESDEVVSKNQLLIYNKLKGK